MDFHQVLVETAVGSEMGLGQKMQKALAAVMMAVVCVVAAAMVCGDSFESPDLSYRSLDYDVQVLKNGDMRVVEHIDMHLKKREDDGNTKPWRQLYQRYKLDANKLTAITDVSVKNVTSGKTYTKTDPYLPSDYTVNGEDEDWDKDQANHWYLAAPDVEQPGMAPDNGRQCNYEPNRVRLRDKTTDQFGNKLRVTGLGHPVDSSSGSSANGVVSNGGPHVVGADDVTGFDNFGMSDDFNFNLNPSPEYDYDDTYCMAEADTHNTMTVELGWNIPTTVSADSMKFDIAMTFKGVATQYPDVTYLKWEPFGDENQTPIGKVSGTVKLPKGADTHNSWAWLHYDGNSTTNRGKNGTLHFTANNVTSGKHLDLVAMASSKLSSGVVRVGSKDIKKSVMDEERYEEQQYRSTERAKVFGLLFVMLAGLAVFLECLYYGVKLVIKALGTRVRQQDVTYYRDLPGMSPAAAAEVWNCFEMGTSSKLFSRQISATVLSLASKKAIAIYPGPADYYAGVAGDPNRARQVGAQLATDPRGARELKSTSTIAILPVCSANRASLSLSDSEESALSLLEGVSVQIGSPVYDLEQMKLSVRNWNNGLALQQDFIESSSCEFDGLHVASYASKLPIPVVGMALVAVLGFRYFIYLSMPMVGLVVFGVAALAASAVYGLTRGAIFEKAGMPQTMEVLGFKKYLEDFSDFSKRDVPDLILWDQYLVYATALGIANKVIARLAAAYPNLTDPAWLDDYATGSLLYWYYRPAFWAGADSGFTGGSMESWAPSLTANFGDIGAQLSDGFASVGNAISSSGDSGGSFGGGGFGGSGGGSGGGSFGGR